MEELTPEMYDENGFWREHDEVKPTDEQLWEFSKLEASRFFETTKPLSNLFGFYANFAFLGMGGYGAVLKVTSPGKVSALKLFLNVKRAEKNAKKEVANLIYMKQIARRECNAATCCPGNLSCYKNHFRAQLGDRVTHLLMPKLTVPIDPSNKYYIIESEFVNGVTLHALLVERGSKPFENTVEQILSTIHTALRALKFMHEFMMFHRDIKTDNIMLFNRYSKRPESVLLDLGIGCAKDACVELHVPGTNTYKYSRLLFEEQLLLAANVFQTGQPKESVPAALEVLTRYGMMKNGVIVETHYNGTLVEQITAAMDVYALGSVFYYWINGSVPLVSPETAPRLRPKNYDPRHAEIWSLIEDMTNIKIRKRITAYAARNRALKLLEAISEQ
jgi:serine/threonine protein kinase